MLIFETNIQPTELRLKMQFDIYTLIFAGLAIFVAYKLKSVLGTKTGDEKPPHDPFNAKTSQKPAGYNDNVISLPNVSPRVAEPDELPNWRWEGIAKEGSPVSDGLDTLVNLDSSFDPRHFLDGAKHAYEMIVTAFAHGDRKTLKNLLARDVFDGFNSVILAREQQGNNSEVTFVSIDKNDLVGAQAKEGSMQISVRFQSKMIRVTRDKSGTTIDGSADTVVDVTDIWTFAKEANARDPNWKLVSTEAGH